MNRDELEEALLFNRTSMPRMWWNIYQGCLDTGFDKRESFALLQTYVLSQGTGNITPPDISGNSETDNPEAL